MVESTGRIRIGGVPYQVGAPLVTGLDTRKGVDLRCEPPTRLVEDLRRGGLDAALVSSIEGFRRPGYLALPDLGIGCDGEVRSVRLFLRTEPRDVRSLALDAGSQTSTALTEILLRRRYRARLERSWRIAPDRMPDRVDADGVLLIGDAGLHADPGSRQVLDLGAEWKDWKALPFVFALWLLPPPAGDVAGSRPPAEDERIRRVSAMLREAWARGKEQGVEDGTGGSIQYELGSEHLAALGAFREEALASGLCEPGAKPRFLGGRQAAEWRERG